MIAESGESAFSIAYFDDEVNYYYYYFILSIRLLIPNHDVFSKTTWTNSFLF